MANIGLPSVSVCSLAVGRDGRLYAGTSGGGVFISEDGADHWIAIRRSNHEEQYVHSIAASSTGEVFAGTENTGFFHTTDDGASWADLKPEWSTRRI